MSNAVAKENSAIELIKSALAIPLVIALVMGTAWGLVHWAAQRQRESGKPDPRPAVAGPDGSLALQIPFAQVSGQIHFGGGGGKPSLGNWRQADETVAWRFEVEKTGRYAVELDCACGSADAGSVVRVEMDGTSLQATIPDTGGPHSFKNIRAGEADVRSAGWQELHIVPVTVAHKSVMTLRGVRLVPVGTSS